MDPLFTYILGIITGVLAVCGVTALLLKKVFDEDPSTTSERDGREG